MLNAIHMKNLKGKTVLIVDDDERNIFALASYLETLELKVFKSPDGAEAMSLLNAGTRVDIILLDMMMPVIDGYETLNSLKKNPEISRIPVIAITAKAMKGDRERSLNAGAWDY